MKWLFRALGALPLGFHYAFSRFLAWILRSVLHYRRDVIVTNLSRSFPEKKYDEIAELTHDFYAHFGRVFAESVWLGGCRDPERLHRQHLVEFGNIEMFTAAYEGSPGVVLLNSHFGNWELTGGFLEYDYRPDSPLKNLLHPDDVAVVYKPLKSKAWDEIIRENRCAPIFRRGFNGYVPAEKVLRFAVEKRDRKMLYIFLSDQCPYKGSIDDDAVEFLHQPTKTMLGGASIAHKFGYSVLYMSIAPVSNGRYEWSFTEICRDASGMSPHDIMQEYYRLLQADIVKNPCAYLWSHKRWKR